MHTSSPAPTTYRPEAIETAVERVLAIGRKLLSDSPEQLLLVLERQARQRLAQAAELAEHRQQLQVLQSEIAPLKATQLTGSVAPFRIDEKKRTKAPKPSGRKPGHQGVWRQSPPPSAHDAHIEVRVSQCPECGHDLALCHQRAIDQTIIEVPVVVPRIIRLRTYRNHCDHCEAQVSSPHPLQVSRATGAAGTQLGPRTLGLAAMLNKDVKLTMRKTTQVLEA
ncbi:MAG: hypothetical protein AAF766_08450 [Cyanobacteria bacterium P01_D01_bin.14]